MLFANIAALVAKGVTVQFTINAASEGKLEVSLTPTAAEGTTLNLVPKSFVGTPAELDAEFGDVIAGYAAVNLSLKQQLEDVATVAKAIEKEASDAAARKAAAKPAPRTSGTAKSPAKTPTLIEGGGDQDGVDGADGEDGGQAGVEASTPPGTVGQSQVLPLEL